MSRIAVVGGHGRVALELHPLLVAAGHIPVALVRNQDYRAELGSLGAEVRIVDIESDDATAFAAAFDGCEAVVFAAGGGADGDKARKLSVDLGGSVKSIKGAKLAGVTRFVQISAIGVDADLPEDTDDVWRTYVEAKRDADVALRDSDLAWTIVRPGQLTGDRETGLVTLGDHVERGPISRADVAAVVVAALGTPSTVRSQFEVVGGQTPVAEAVGAATAHSDNEE